MRVRESSLGKVICCDQHMIGDSGGWGSIRNSQGAMSCLFAGQENAKLEEVAVYQRDVSRELATLHTWVAVMVNTEDSKNRDTEFNFYPLHAL